MKYFCHVKEPLMGIFPLERNTSTNYSFLELQVNCLKLQKRIVYGRANFDLLRLRVLSRG